jgi:hypothetical protein
MSEPLPPQAPSPAPVVPESGGGFLQNLVDLYFAPREAFSRIVRRPTFVFPLVGYIVLALGFTALWLNKVDAREFVKTQLEDSGRWEKIPAEQREAVLDRAPAQLKLFGWLGPFVFTPVVLLATAAVLLFVFRFFYGGEVGFRQAFAIACWAFFAVALVTTPLLLLVFQLKGDWNLNPQEVLQANLGLLLDKSTAAKPLWALFTSIDLFSLWLVFLLAVGFGVASRKSTGSALWGVGIPWAILVLIKVGWAAMF